MTRYVTQYLDRDGPVSLMFDFDQELSRLAGVTVLCIGDLMLDDFVYGEVARISPEAPAPVIAVKRSDMIDRRRRQCRAQYRGRSAPSACLSVWSATTMPAARCKAALPAEKRIEATLVVDPSRPTTRKVRFVSEHYSTHLLRADWELAKPVDGATEKRRARPRAARLCRKPARWCCRITPRAR